MASSEAIQGATSSLLALLGDRMQPAPSLSAGPPVAGDSKRVNLFLYKVQENAALRNQDAPDPRTANAPPLSLDLHYLLTVLGTTPDEELSAQQLLGEAMLVLHDFGIIDPELPLVRTTGTVLDPVLADDGTRLTISQNPLSLEDLTKIWTALAVPYRVSAAYVVTVVQIRSRKVRHSAPPVRDRRLFVVPLKRPSVNDVSRKPPFEGMPAWVAEPGDVVRVRGLHFRSPSTRVTLGAQAPLVPAVVSDTALEFTLPPNAAAGLVELSVVRDGADGPPPIAKGSLRSNAVPLQVLPKLMSITPPSLPASGVLTLTLAAPVARDDDVSLLLGDVQIPAEPHASPTASPTFALGEFGSALSPGNYLVRVRVNGAESRLTVDPGTQAYTGPVVQVT